MASQKHRAIRCVKPGCVFGFVFGIWSRGYVYLHNGFFNVTQDQSPTNVRRFWSMFPLSRATYFGTGFLSHSQIGQCQTRAVGISPRARGNRGDLPLPGPGLGGGRPGASSDRHSGLTEQGPKEMVNLVAPIWLLGLLAFLVFSGSFHLTRKLNFERGI